MTRKLGSGAAVNPMAMMEELNAKALDAEVALQEITVVPGFNPRRLLSDDALQADALADLTESIRTYGLIQPLIVRRKGTQIQLIAGERRLGAARLAGLKKVPVMFLEVDDDQAYEIAVLENGQRQDLDLVTETLIGFDLLSRRLKMDQEAVVAYLNAVRKGRREDDLQVEPLLRRSFGTGITAWSQRRASILKMLPGEHAAIRQGQVDTKVCAELVVLGTDVGQRALLLQRAINEKLSADQMRRLVRDILNREDQGSRSLSTRIQAVKKDLPRLTRLTGTEAVRADKLIADLETKLSALLHP
ncbi:ParB/RepB/Spo0J family partition protein [Deinococcus alpinitundrae]|uniref:ParB/RepB/Spo0J family partition protein n=1 Tax=Deinococcus alpinitundrae TaxID=468913 RepID=UPI00137ABA32|nr:ParB/RepB/Spo0J family partition protein [Deinococcus alpinitundrae]